MGREIAITLNDEQQGQLDRLARASNESAEQLIQRALARLLQEDLDFCAAVQVGIDEADAGNVRDFDDVAAELRAKVVQRLRDAGH